MLPPRDLRPLFWSGSFRPGFSQGWLFTLGPSLGPQSEIDAPPWAPLWNSCCSAPRSWDPLGAFQKSFKRQMKILKSAHFFLQKIRPGELLQIQDPPKRAPLNLIHVPEASLAATGASNARLGTLPGAPWKSYRAHFEKKHDFCHKSLKPLYL